MDPNADMDDPQDQDEEVKQGDVPKTAQPKTATETQEEDVYARGEEAVAEMPWRKALAEDDSDISKMKNMGPRMFSGRQKSLVLVANSLNISDTPITGFIELANGDREVVSAVVF